ncbi:hypothetical protein M427DRAFT_63206 [Gonapodya prolifera JEL478]|uniref:Monalysin Pore-forming domain-containing protein n=1 Tax=Gonapodya prolifera (strain JEL478) TaxID=1344416 RepID=A0A138ZZP4_GONPJ|nr:hypothetical protein M427DRAFT_63206 [Gonapodya prolifera JEL478]|eukprot:KXS09970.1 hypothetical protein M427DRAFT_63206 [Gonapodya prolifera JEL478]
MAHLLGKTVVIRTFFDNYLRCGDERLDTAEKASGWERFTLVDIGGGKVALKSRNWYASPWQDRTVRAVPNIGNWEQLEFISNPDDTYSFRTWRGVYISTEGKGNHARVGTQDAIGQWEKFRIFTLPPPPSSQLKGVPSDLDLNLQVAVSNYDIDDAIGKLENAACVVRTKWVPGQIPNCNGTTVRALIKPVAAYQTYIEMKHVPSNVGSKVSFTQRKGVTKTTTLSTDVRASVGVNIKGCEVSLEVGIGYSVGTELKVEEETSVEVTITGPITLYTYQTVLVYVTRMELTDDAAIFVQLENLPYIVKDGYIYFFTPLYKEGTQRFETKRQPVQYQNLVGYLMNAGFSKWQSE